MNEFTQNLEAARQGDAGAAAKLLPLVYDELRKLAAAKMARESPSQTLQPTALVHEAWLRLSGEKQPRWDGCGHFFGAAAEAMRRILIDRARRKRAQRHGGGMAPLDLDGLEVSAETAKPDELLDLDKALEKLQATDKSKAELVKLRYFAGLTIEQAAETLGISPATAKRWWTFSRAWLYKELAEGKSK